MQYAQMGLGVGGNQFPLVLRVGWTELCKIWGGHRSIIGDSTYIFDFPYVAPFRNHSDFLKLKVPQWLENYVGPKLLGAWSRTSR